VRGTPYPLITEGDNIIAPSAFPVFAPDVKTGVMIRYCDFILYSNRSGTQGGSFNHSMAIDSEFGIAYASDVYFAMALKIIE